MAIALFAAFVLVVAVLSWIVLRLFANQYGTAKSAAGWAALSAFIILAMLFGFNYGIQWFFKPGQSLTEG